MVLFTCSRLSVRRSGQHQIVARAQRVPGASAWPMPELAPGEKCGLAGVHWMRTGLEATANDTPGMKPGVG